MTLHTILAFSNAALCQTNPSTTAQTVNRDKDPQLQQTVKWLGLESRDAGQDFEKLRSNPHVAASLLVAQLHPILRKAYYPDHRTKDSQHVICCLRALRYLTGITFSAKTNEKLSDDEKQFLDFKTEMHDTNPEHKLHFFGVWMSRDAEFVAPEDTQKRIIDQWRKWQHDFGGTFQYSPTKKPSDAMDDWYWYG